MIALPDDGILIAQDFLYHGVHVFLGERAFDTWIHMLQEFKMLPYDLLLAGHGAPSGSEIYDEMIRYFSLAREALARSSSGDDLKERLIVRFPNLGGHVLLDQSATLSLSDAYGRRSDLDRPLKLHDAEPIRGVTCRFVKNCTLRENRWRCKGGSEWSQLPISQATVTTPVVFAGQFDVSPFQQ
jgi:hypothetical protein